MYKKVALFAGIILLLFLCLICPTLNWLNGFANESLGGCFVLKSEVADWFAFWGSFSGTIATVLVGVITIRLTEKIELDNKKAERLQKEAEKLQKKMAIVMNMPDIICKSVKIYSFNKGDIHSDFLERFAENRNYCVLFEIQPAFPAYFIISLVEYELSFSKGQTLKEKITIGNLTKEKDYSIINHGDFSLFLNADKKAESCLYYFYSLHLQNTNATPYSDKNVNIRLRLKCENALLSGDDSTVEFDMILTLETEGKREGCVNLKVNNIQFEKAVSNRESMI